MLSMLEDWDVERYRLSDEVRPGELGVRFIRATDVSMNPPTDVMIKAMPRATPALLERRTLPELVGADLAKTIAAWLGTEQFPTLSAFLAHVDRSFRAEADGVASLRHPNVLRLLDRGETWRWSFHVYEIGGRTTLFQHITDRGVLSVEETVVIAAQLADVLATLHDSGRVHPFAYPHNLLVEQNLHLRVSGFALGWEWAQTAVPAYSAPEQLLRGDRTPAGDVYVFAGVVWKMLTGKPYVETDGDSSAIAFHAAPHPPALETRVRNCPRWLARLVRACLAPSPADRPTARQILDEIEGRVPPAGIPSVATHAADLLATRWPAPFGGILRELVMVRSPDLAWRRVLELGESVIKTAVAIGAGLSGGEVDLGKRPGLGTWMEVLHALTKRRATALFNSDALADLDMLVAWRNEVAHGAMGDAARSLDALERRAPRVLKVLHDSATIRGISWTDGPQFEGRAFSRPDLVRVEACATCGRREPFFFNNVANNGRQRNFLSYETGHTLVVDTA